MALVIGALLSVLGFGISVYQTWHFYGLRSGTGSLQAICNLGERMNCDQIAASRYAELAFGIPLSSAAAGWYIAILILLAFAFDPKRLRAVSRVLFGMGVAGVLVSAYYLAIMLFAMNTFCVFCLAIDAINLALLGLTWKLKQSADPKTSVKPYLGWAVAAIVVTTLAMKGMDRSSRISESEIEQLSQLVLEKAPLSIQVGPDNPTFGDPNAPITIVKFSDFQCPFCRVGATMVHGLLASHPGRVKVVFKNFPLDASCNRAMTHSPHLQACEAAKLANCAHRQGKFEAAFNRFFEQQEELSKITDPTKVRQLLEGRGGIDLVALDACMKEKLGETTVGQDVEEAIRLDLSSTPTFFINGRKIMGLYPMQVWNRIIDQLIAVNGKR